MVMPAETLATSKVKIANIYDFVRRNWMIYMENLNTIEFCFTFMSYLSFTESYSFFKFLAIRQKVNHVILTPFPI